MSTLAKLRLVRVSEKLSIDLLEQMLNQTRRGNMNKLRLLLILFIGLLIYTPSANAQEDALNGITMEIAGGFDGYYASDEWVPFEITVANNGPAINGVLEIRRSVNTSYAYRQIVDLPTQSRKKITVYVHGTDAANPRIYLYDENDNELLVQRTGGMRRVNVDDLFYGVVSDDVINLDSLEKFEGDFDNARVAYISPTSLPKSSQGWNGLDVLLLASADLSKVETATLEALRSWVSAGGQLVVMGGLNAQTTASAVQDLLPSQFSTNLSGQALPNLSNDLGVVLDSSGYLVTSSTLNPGATALMQEGNLPIWSRRPLGTGHIHTIALDPNLEPMQNLAFAEKIWTPLAESVPQQAVWETGFVEGYQAQQAASIFPSLRPPPIWLLGVFLGVYILIIGPLNYIILQRMQRRELAWLTIPAIIALFVGAAYVMGGNWRGRNPLVNQVSIATGCACGDETAELSVESMVSVFSPRADTYTITFPDNVLPKSEAAVSTYYGGPNNEDNVRYFTEFTPSPTIQNFRVNLSDSREFYATTTAPMPNIQSELIWDDDANRLKINIRNNSDIDLEETALFWGVGYIKVGDIPAGETITLDKAAIRGRFELERVLQAENGGSIMIQNSTGGSSQELRTHDLLAGDEWATDVRNDPIAFGRYRLLDATMPRYRYYDGAASASIPKGRIALVGWTKDPVFDVALQNANATLTGQTLYVIELPINGN